MTLGGLASVVLGKAGHRAKWNNKALPPAANKHTFLQCTSSQFFLCSKHYVMYSYHGA